MKKLLITLLATILIGACGKSDKVLKQENDQAIIDVKIEARIVEEYCKTKNKPLHKCVFTLNKKGEIIKEDGTIFVPKKK